MSEERQAAIAYRAERDKREAEAKRRELRRKLHEASSSAAAAEGAYLVATREGPDIEPSVEQAPAFSDLGLH